LTKPTGADALAAELAGRLGHAIKRAEQALNTAKSAALREFNLTVPQYTVLHAVSYLPGSSGAQLARVCEVTPQTMTTVLANLEAKNLIVRTQSSVHQKVLVTTLTSGGRTLLRKAGIRERAVEDDLADAFDPAERALLIRLLERAAAVLNGEPDLT
jgi:DNA-binding MarR family transcriptional regulator